jgi:[ribosomal protein S5]-alanine N-acetyltransferase
MKIVTANLVMRDVVKDDFSAVHDIASQPEVCQYQAWGPNTESETREYFENCFKEQGEKQRKNFNLVVSTIDNNNVIATCGIFLKEGNTAEIGFSIGKEYWRKGFGTKIASTLRDYCIDELNCNKIIATCDSLNKGSQALLEKVGFSQKSFIKSDMEIKGRIRDTIVYKLSNRNRI